MEIFFCLHRVCFCPQCIQLVETNSAVRFDQWHLLLAKRNPVQNVYLKVYKYIYILSRICVSPPVSLPIPTNSLRKKKKNSSNRIYRGCIHMYVFIHVYIVKNMQSPLPPLPRFSSPFPDFPWP